MLSAPIARCLTRWLHFQVPTDAPCRPGSLHYRINTPRTGPKGQERATCIDNTRSVVLQQTDTFEYYATEHFRLSGVYWGLCGMAVLGRLQDMDEDAIVAWVRTCQVRRLLLR